MFQLILHTLSGRRFDAEIAEATIPTSSGQIGILTGHMPLISIVKAGIISIRRHTPDPDELLEYFAISGGAVHIEHNEVHVLVDEADDEKSLDEQEIKKAYERAKAMKAEATDKVSLDHAQSLLDRQAVRLDLANLKRRHHRS